MDNRITVETCDLTTGYRRHSSARIVTGNINASLRSGELTCLLGPNGAGKSTLLKTLSGFLPPVSGSVEVCGRPLRDYRDRELARVLGVVLTERPVLDNMTVAELVTLGRSPYTGFWGRGNAEDKAVVSRSLELVGISRMAHRLVSTLSDGERQKAMIAKALAQATPVIFLDEPTAFLDYPSKVEMMRLLHHLAHTHDKTIFLSTHDLDLALQLADKVWLVAKDTEPVTGTPEDLALSGRLGEFFCRDGVRFDAATGLFALDMPTSTSVRLTGEAPFVTMAAKALLRNGILPSAFGPAINATESGFDVDGRRCGSIDQMLHTVKDVLQQ